MFALLNTLTKIGKFKEIILLKIKKLINLLQNCQKNKNLKNNFPFKDNF